MDASAASRLSLLEGVMPHVLSQQVWSTIERHLPASASGELLVALSGGLDSIVLLHALVDATDHPRRVRAVHINHQLHPDASRWQAHCARVAFEIGVELSICTVRVPDNPPQGVEAAAREVRYRALESVLRPGESLLTAHHADDQLETVLLALLRGSGVDGLAAMPACKPFGEGWHLRPLLERSRSEISAWAHEHCLTWLDDPSNDSARFDRNYLRRHVVPQLRERWPAAAVCAGRSAAHLGEALALLDDIAASDYASAALGQCLKVSTLRSLSGARRRNLLRYWLRRCGATTPSTRKLAAIEHDMLAAQEDRSPCVDWDEFEVRRHRGLMYCLRGQSPMAAETSVDWAWTAPLDLTAGSGLLRAEISHGRGLAVSKLPKTLRVGTRQGGEVLRLPGHVHRRPLKKLLQEANVLPWWRERLPLVFVDDRLAAVADLWVSADFAATDLEEGVQIVWEQRPQVEGVLPH